MYGTDFLTKADAGVHLWAKYTQHPPGKKNISFSHSELLSRWTTIIHVFPGLLCVQQWLELPCSKSIQACQKTRNPRHMYTVVHIPCLHFWKVLLHTLFRAARWIYVSPILLENRSYWVGTIHTHIVKDLPRHQITHIAPGPHSQLRQGRFDISWIKSCICKFK